MGKITGFKEYKRQIPEDRPVIERLKDFQDVHTRLPEDPLKLQAARCMDCGVPFCHKGCPLGNIIPDWNDLVYHNRWNEALESLLSTNNFPEFTGRICPAPCEASCVLGINEPPVTIEQIELNIIEHAFDSGRVKPRVPKARTGKKVAVIGSGPAGLAAAGQLNQAGHSVTVFERANRPGGLLMYGIPNFKLDKKKIVERRISLMQAEGIEFKCNAHVGVNVPAEDIKKNFDAIVLSGGAALPRDLNVPGRELKGIHFALEFLSAQNSVVLGDKISEDKIISAKGKNVVVLGGGDTGSDCHGTSLRHGAKEVWSLELLPKPPAGRQANNPWPEWPKILRTSSSHEEGGKRDWNILTKSFTGINGQVKKVNAVRIDWKKDAKGAFQMVEIPGSELSFDADLVLLALGFLGAEKSPMMKSLGVNFTDRGNIAADHNYMTNVPGIFACGDMHRGQSLVVWAIWEGREAARGVDKFLMGKTQLPSSPFHI